MNGILNPVKRRKELIDKADQAIKDVLGDRRDSMFYIGIVWTAPAEQGHGYASALIRIVTAKVRIAQFP